MKKLIDDLDSIPTALTDGYRAIFFIEKFENEQNFQLFGITNSSENWKKSVNTLKNSAKKLSNSFFIDKVGLTPDDIEDAPIINPFSETKDEPEPEVEMSKPKEKTTFISLFKKKVR